MESFTLRSHLCFPNHSNLTTANPPYFIPIRTTSQLKHLPNSSPCRKIEVKKQSSHIIKPLILELTPKTQETQRGNNTFFHVSPNGYSRFVILGAVTLGFVLFLIGVVDEEKALALGPEGPLMEDFWDNMRRYGLYILTVSTGVAYTILQPILELLRNPITAVLILVIFGGSFYIVSQVLSAMVGVSEFNYQYGY